MTRGKGIPNIETGVMIAKALDVSAEYLVTGEDSQKGISHRLSKTSRHIGQLAEQLEPQKREFVLDNLKWLLSLKDCN